ncbi:type II toxin-antitoxin system PemK/MazF family toxin [Aerococcus viridans]|uniref:type II toxin-antitoxin system PemK/MazF family toxin n=1 Tax=Aerococcus viridans TaxID=1377 RepID=UPI0039AED887
MDYKRKENKEALKEFKNEILQSLDAYLDNEMESNQKKVANIVYWLKDYKNYLKNEKRFAPRFLPTYKYGTIIQVNFGFNVQHEYGGLHYAIVLDNNDNKYKSTLTVMPLSSIKEGADLERLKNNNYILGTEFYQLYSNKINTLSETTKERLKELRSDTYSLSEKIKLSEDEREVDLFIQQLNEIKYRISEAEKSVKYLEDCKAMINKMKFGSIAKLTSITTISKMRINNPQKSQDTLSGIVLSEDTMQKITFEINKRYGKK